MHRQQPPHAHLPNLTMAAPQADPTSPVIERSSSLRLDDSRGLCFSEAGAGYMVAVVGNLVFEMGVSARFPLSCCGRGSARPILRPDPRVHTLSIRLIIDREKQVDRNPFVKARENDRQLSRHVYLFVLAPRGWDRR